MKINYFLIVLALFFLQSCGSPTRVIIKKEYAQTLTQEGRKVRVDIPEIYELMLVATALTDFEQRNHFFIDTTTSYYKKMREHFKNHENHPLVKRLNKGYTKAFWRVFNFSTLNRQGGMYVFENGTLKNLNHYKLPWLMRSLPTPLVIFKKNKGRIEDFYQKTQFLDFYKKHQIYYDTLIQQTQTVSGIEDIWVWLEDNFPTRKQGYRVITSPLIGSVHNTVQFQTNDKKVSEMVCFVSPIEDITEGNRFGYQKMFMTEINENYAHIPPQYLPELEKAMAKNMLKWNNGNAVARYYKSVERTFNENFTHAVMACYGYDRYEPAVFEKKWADWQRNMVEKRGFPMFKEFSDELLRLYKNRKQGEKVSDLLAPMVEWVKKNA